MKITKQTFSFDKRLFFGVLCLYYFLNTYILSEVLVNKELYYQTYGEQVAFEQIDTYVESSQKWSWIGYILLPISLFIKICFVAFCLNIGMLLSNIKIGFKKLFQIVLIAQSIFAIASFVKAIWLLFFVDVNVLQDIQLFYPLSLLTLFDKTQVEGWYIYPLQTLNLFELTYWLLLAKGLQMVLNENYPRMFRLVASSYGVGILIWMVVVVFLSVSLS